MIRKTAGCWCFLLPLCGDTKFSVKFDIYKCVAFNHTLAMFFEEKTAMPHELCQMCVSLEKSLYWTCMWLNRKTVLHSINTIHLHWMFKWTRIYVIQFAMIHFIHVFRSIYWGEKNQMRVSIAGYPNFIENFDESWSSSTRTPTWGA